MTVDVDRSLELQDRGQPAGVVVMAVAEHDGGDVAQVLAKGEGVLHDGEPLAGIEQVVAVVCLHKAGEAVFADDPEGDAGRVFAEDGQSYRHCRFSLPRVASCGKLC